METFTLATRHPYTLVNYDGVKYRVNEILSTRTKQLGNELLWMDRLTPEFLVKRREYEAAADVDFNRAEARHPGYSPKFYQDERGWYKLLKQRDLK